MLELYPQGSCCEIGPSFSLFSPWRSSTPLCLPFPQPHAAGLEVVECRRQYVIVPDFGFPAQLLSETHLNCLLALGAEPSWTKSIHFGFQTHGIFSAS